MTVVAVITSLFSYGQLMVNSPYSRFGLGELYKNESGISRSMGGISYGLRSTHFINSKNPASYTSVDTATFLIDVGYSGIFVFSETATANNWANYFNLDYLKASFPVTKWWRTSIGLSPFSTVSYNVKSVSEIDSIGTINTSYLGDGGINRFTFGNGFKLGKHLSVGVNSSYLFGNMNYSKLTEVPDNINIYNFRLTNTTSIRNLYFDFGAQYHNVFGKEKNNFLTVGGVFGNQQNLRATSSTFGETFLASSTGYEYIKDTIIDSENGTGEVIMPMFYGFGFNFQKSDKWSFGADYSAQNWADFKSFGKSDSLTNTKSINLGGSYRVGKVMLRAGARYYDSYLTLNGYNIQELGITFGTSIPLFIDQQTKTFPYLDLGAEVGTRGTTANGLIQQTYTRFFVGLSIKSSWFNRPKYY